MKISMLVIALFFSVCIVQAQNIRKVKIKEVLHYIDTTQKPVVINFWATWCAPCVHELAYFEKEIQKAAGDKVQILLVSVDSADDYPKTIEKFIQEHGYTSTVWWLNETNAADFCPKIDKTWNGNIPATLMYNPSTHYRKFYNRQLTAPQIPEAVEQLLSTAN
jgi:thiol-disulfide isomerase/thioredoxin